MQAFTAEQDFPFLMALKKANAPSYKRLKELFDASSGFDDEKLLTLAQQLFLTAEFLPNDYPGIPLEIVQRTEGDLAPIFEHYAHKGDLWSAQVLWFRYSRHGKEPDKKREEFWEEIYETNTALPNSKNLEDALLYGDLARFQELYDMGIKPCPQFLITAIANARLKSAIWILQQPDYLGLDLDAQDDFSVQGNQEFLSNLPFDTKDPFGWQKGEYLRNSALILAMKKGWRRGETGKMTHPCMGDIICMLLERGANPDLQDGCGNTALHIAVLHRDAWAIKTLLEAGADENIVNNGGFRPVDLLAVDYSQLNPFLYLQTGHDTYRYIHTLLPEDKWLKAGKEAERLLYHIK
jgi:hypothetical protein